MNRFAGYLVQHDIEQELVTAPSAKADLDNLVQAKIESILDPTKPRIALLDDWRIYVSFSTRRRQKSVKQTTFLHETESDLLRIVS